MTGKDLKNLIKKLEKEHADFNELEVVIGDSNVTYVSELGRLRVIRLEEETNDRFDKGSYRYADYDAAEDKPGKRLLVFEY